MRRLEALDGIRGIAVLTVFAQHAGVPGTMGAGAAVDVFFVLSGFLISGILLDEMSRSRRIDLYRFYRRRFMRLTPPLTLMALGYILVAPHDAGAALLSLFYLTDYARAFLVEAGPLSHTWSLAVEEHFYLLWPLAVLVRSDFSRDKVTLGSVALGLAVAGTFTFLSGHGSLTLGITIAEAAAFRVILTAVEEKEASGLTRFLSLPWLVYVGRISYGLYLFHHPFTWALDGTMHWTLVVAATLPASLALAALSYHFIERPILDSGGASQRAKLRGARRAASSIAWPVGGRGTLAEARA